MKKPEFKLNLMKKPEFRFKPEDWHLCRNLNIHGLAYEDENVTSA